MSATEATAAVPVPAEEVKAVETPAVDPAPEAPVAEEAAPVVEHQRRKSRLRNPTPPPPRLLLRPPQSPPRRRPRLRLRRRSAQRAQAYLPSSLPPSRKVRAR